MKKSKSVKGSRTPSKGKRDVFGELMEGMEALAKDREGKATLKTHPVEYKGTSSLVARRNW